MFLLDDFNPNDAHETKILKLDGVVDYISIYNSTQNSEHKLSLSETTSLYDCFKELCSYRETFYICKACKVLTATKNRLYNHEQCDIVKVSKLKSREPIVCAEQIQKQLKRSFFSESLFQDKDNKIILYPFNQKKSCTLDSWNKAETTHVKAKSSKSLQKNKISKKTVKTVPERDIQVDDHIEKADSLSKRSFSQSKIEEQDSIIAELK